MSLADVDTTIFICRAEVATTRKKEKVIDGSIILRTANSNRTAA